LSGAQSQEQEQARSIFETFAAFRPALVERPLADFSGLRNGSAPYCEVAPRNGEALSQVVRLAHAREVPLRLRAQGHSLNGASLPQAGELLVSARNLRHVRFEEPGTVTAGAGVVLWVLQYILRRHGFDLPVLNDGYPGPSVGGYLAAGGFGPRSAAHGGFWDNVLEARIVDGYGELRRVTADDALFPWLFGSMGQLGALYDATLAIVPLAGSGASEYPAGKRLVAPQLAPPKVPLEYATAENERLFWFTLFVPDEHLAQAHAALSALERRHRGALRFQQRYLYPIRQRGRVAPLVYPEARPFTATGAWGWLGDSSQHGVDRLLDFDQDFMSIAGSKPYYRRYAQSELPSGPETYQRCFGPETCAGFRRRKAELDPKSILNRGSVFAAPGAPAAAV
jgi:FAD/FMN-containing dehydrogenase